MNVGTILLVIWVVMYATFIHYLAIMNAMRVRDQIPWPAWFFLGPGVIIGVLFDVLLNAVVGTILFMDIPREWVFTKRLARYRKQDENSKRGKLACFFCEKILNVFSPDKKHC